MSADVRQSWQIFAKSVGFRKIGIDFRKIRKLRSSNFRRNRYRIHKLDLRKNQEIFR